MKVFLTCKDHTVTNEEFQLLLDDSLEMLITSPQPSVENLASYYESEDYISHTNSKKTLFDKMYQLVKKHAIRKKVALINAYVDDNSKTNSILDIGCGTGDFLIACKKRGWSITGIEPSKKANSFAQGKLETAILNDISEIKNQKFDCISMWHVLEHVPNLENYIKSLKRLLNPNGTLIVAVPNFKSYDANHYGKFWAAYDVPRHLWHFSKKSIRLLFEKEKMNIVKMVPMKFDAFYVSLLSEKYTIGKSNPFRAFMIGLRSNFSALRSKEYSSIIYVLKNN